MNTLALMRLRRLWVLFTCGVVFSGCAPMIATTPSSVELAQDGTTARSITIQAPAVIQLDTGYSRTLAAKSVWKPVGR
ncbi:hypothetical protein FCJ59_36940, partial [Cupriavidus basilensis]|nr:hypothetical protein [Cupriavidus basilensis]